MSAVCSFLTQDPVVPETSRVWRCLALFCCMWLLVAPGQAAPVSLPLDEAQRSWLAEHRQLRVGVVLQAPYAQFDRRVQQLTGANVELMGLLGSALQVELVWQQYGDQEALDDALRKGLVDLAPGQVQTPAGLRLWLYSDPYMRVPQLLVGARNGGTAIDLEQLDGRDPLAVLQRSAVATYLQSTYGNLELQAVSSDRQALRYLLGRQVSYVVIDEAQFSRLSREGEFSGLTVVADIGLPQLLRVASRRDWPELSTLVDTALRSLSARQLEALRGRWLKLAAKRSGFALPELDRRLGEAAQDAGVELVECRAGLLGGNGVAGANRLCR